VKVNVFVSLLHVRALLAKAVPEVTYTVSAGS